MTPKQKKLLAQAAVLKRQAKKLGIEIRERDRQLLVLWRRLPCWVGAQKTRAAGGGKMSDTEKLLADALVEAHGKKLPPGAIEQLEPQIADRLLAEIEELFKPRLVLDYDFLEKAYALVPQLVKMVREQQKQRDEQREDIVELLHELGPCERDEPRDYCFTHGQSACGWIAEMRTKYGVKP